MINCERMNMVGSWLNETDDCERDGSWLNKTDDCEMEVTKWDW